MLHVMAWPLPQLPSRQVVLCHACAAAGVSAEKPKLEAAVGARRICRTIKWTAADGSPASRCAL